MAKRICTILGVGFLLVGVLGFVSPSFLGYHLSVAHNLVHLISGAAALYFGVAGTLAGARTFCLAFGAVYLLLGLAGFVLGTSQPSTLPGMASMGNDTRLWRVIPETLELGIMDHILHVALGVILLAGGLVTRADAGRTTARD